MIQESLKSTDKKINSGVKKKYIPRLWGARGRLFESDHPDKDRMRELDNFDSLFFYDWNVFGIFLPKM